MPRGSAFRPLNVIVTSTEDPLALSERFELAVVDEALPEALRKYQAEMLAWAPTFWKPISDHLVLLPPLMLKVIVSATVVAGILIQSSTWEVKP